MDGPQTGTFNDAGRLFAVRQLRVLDTAPEAVFDRFTRVAIAVTGASAAMLSVLDASRQFVKSSIGLPDPWGAGRNLPLSHSFCRSVISSRECLVVNDVCVRPTVEGGSIGALGMRAYLVVPLVTPDGLVVGTLSVMDPQPQHWDAEHVRILGDLAEAIVTELQLRIVQRQYEQLLEGATDIIYRTDLGGRFTDVNSVALKLLGYRRDEVIGRSYLEVIRPDYRAVARDAYRRQLIERLPSTYFEFVAQGKDGREVCIGQNVQLMLDQSLPVGFQAIARDITERKQVEAELRSAVERFNLVGQPVTRSGTGKSEPTT